MGFSNQQNHISEAIVMIYHSSTQEGQDGPVLLTWLPVLSQLAFQFKRSSIWIFKMAAIWDFQSNNFCYFWSTSHLHTTNEVWSQLAFWFRIQKFKIDFQHSCYGGHFGFPIRMILDFLELQVTPILPIKVSSQLAFEEVQNWLWQPSWIGKN